MKNDLIERAEAFDDCRLSGARATLIKWTEAVASGQVEAIVALYASDAVLVPTLSNEIVADQEGRRRYFEFLLSDGAPTCTVGSEKTRIAGELGNVTIGGTYTFCFRSTAAREKVPARFLFTFEEIAAHWLITAHHSSRCI